MHAAGRAVIPVSKISQVETQWAAGGSAGLKSNALSTFQIKIVFSMWWDLHTHAEDI